MLMLEFERLEWPLAAAKISSVLDQLNHDVDLTSRDSRFGRGDDEDSLN